MTNGFHISRNVVEVIGVRLGSESRITGSYCFYCLGAVTGAWRGNRADWSSRSGGSRE